MRKYATKRNQAPLRRRNLRERIYTRTKSWPKTMAGVMSRKVPSIMRTTHLSTQHPHPPSGDEKAAEIYLNEVLKSRFEEKISISQEEGISTKTESSESSSLMAADFTTTQTSLYEQEDTGEVGIHRLKLHSPRYTQGQDPKKRPQKKIAGKA